MAHAVLSLALILFSRPGHALNQGVQVNSFSSPKFQDMKRRTVRLMLRIEGQEDQHFCTGVITERNEVLTAGHCFDFLNTESGKKHLKSGRYKVFAKDSSGKMIQGKSMLTGQNAKRGQFDFGYMTLKGNFNINSSIPFAYTGCDDDKRFVFGAGATASGQASENIEMAYYRVSSDSEAKAITQEKIRSWGIKESDYQVFRSVRGNICSGDSGGPIYCISRGTVAIAGITSFTSVLQTIPQSSLRVLDSNGEVDQTRSVGRVCSIKSRRYLGSLNIRKASNLLARVRSRFQQQEQSPRAVDE